MVGQQVDLTLPLLLLQPEFSSSMAEGATAAKENEDSPEQPEPPELIVVRAAASLPTAVTTLTEVGLVVHSWAQLSKQMGLLWMIKDGIQGVILGSISSPNCFPQSLPSREDAARLCYDNRHIEKHHK